MSKQRYFHFICPFCGLPKVLDNRTGDWRHDWARHAAIVQRPVTR